MPSSSGVENPRSQWLAERRVKLSTETVQDVKKSPRLVFQGWKMKSHRDQGRQPAINVFILCRNGRSSFDADDLE
jgi:hypothetical protein